MISLNQNLSSLKRSAIRVYTNLAREVDDCVMLTIGEPDFDTPEEIATAAVTALANGQTHYAPNQGTPALRQAIANYETARGNATAPEQVLVTIGACHALFTALLGILNPGEEIIVPTPGFGLYETIATIAGARTVHLDVTKTGFQIDADALNAAITDRTKAIILNSPCNPTGVVFNRKSLQAVKRAVLGKPIFVICDNVYNQLCAVDCPDLSLDEDLKEQLILCQSFSKPYAMTGWRVGYLTCPDYVMDRLLLLSAAEITAVPTFLQEAAITALQTDPAPMRQVYGRRRRYVCMRLAAMGLRFPDPEGAFYVFPDITPFGMDSATFCTRMIREAKVAAVPGSCFGAEGYIRLSCCCSDADLKKGLDRMEAFVRSLLGGCVILRGDPEQLQRYLDAPKKTVRPRPRFCVDSAHDFRGHPLRCRHCGTEIREDSDITGRYAESFFEGAAYCWKNYFDPEKIVSFSFSSGDGPVVEGECDFETLTLRNCLNGSRDGWMQRLYPKRYFQPRTHRLSPESSGQLRQFLAYCGLELWETPPHYMENHVTQACGFHVSARFACTFRDGRQFICLEPPKEDFAQLVALVEQIGKK